MVREALGLRKLFEANLSEFISLKPTQLQFPKKNLPMKLQQMKAESEGLLTKESSVFMLIGCAGRKSQETLEVSLVLLL